MARRGGARRALLRRAAVPLALALAALACGLPPEPPAAQRPASGAGALPQQRPPLAEPRPINGWILLRADPARLESVLDAAQRYGINHVQLSHAWIMNIDDALGAEAGAAARRLRLRAAAAAAKRRGLQVFVWAHELPEQGTDVCYEPGGPYWRARAQAYRDVLGELPDVDGVVLQFGSSPLAVWKTQCSCGWCAQTYPDASPLARPPVADRIRIVTEQVGAAVVSELGRQLIGRTFIHHPQENAWHSQGFASVRGVPLIGMHKSDEQDWQPYNPPDPTMGHEGELDSVLELDAAGEYYGEAVLPFCAPEYFAWRLEQARRQRGIGTVTRIETDAHSALGTPNEINLLAISRRTLDPQYPLERIWSEFLEQFYGLAAGSPAAAALRSILADSFPIRLASHYVLGLWALEKSSDLPPDAELHQFERAGGLEKLDPRWQPVHDALARPDRQVVLWIWQEASEAVELARTARLRAGELAPALRADRYADLLRRLQHQEYAAQAWRAVKLFIWADRARSGGAADRELLGWMAHAREELVRSAAAMRAAGLDDVPIASPRRIAAFLEATRERVPGGVAALAPAEFSFEPLRTESLASEQAVISFAMSAAAPVTLEYGAEPPILERRLELGSVQPGARRTQRLSGLEPGQRYVVRLRAAVDGREYRSGYHWLFTPEAASVPPAQ